jgi:hypothetical protein
MECTANDGDTADQQPHAKDERRRHRQVTVRRISTVDDASAVS